MFGPRQTRFSKFILIIVAFCVWAWTAPPSGTVIEEHVSMETSSYCGKHLGYQLKQAQQFHLDDGDAGPVSGIGILLKSEDYGSPSGDMTVAIYTDDPGDVPGTLVEGSPFSFTPVLGEWNYVSFPDPGIGLDTGASNKYWIVVTVADQAGDNDAYCWHRSNSNTYDRGYRKTFNSGGSNVWETQPGDFAFRIYGDPTLDVEIPGRERIIPQACRLYDNYPNPFNPTTTIRYRVSCEGSTTIRIYDVHGNEVVTLVNRVQGPGEYAVVWDGCDWKSSDVSSGVYFCRFKSGGRIIETKRMVKMK